MILVLSAMDPTGLSGLTRDVATATDLGQGCATVLTALVAENSSKLVGISWRSAADVMRDLDLVLEELGPSIQAVKFGLIQPSQLATVMGRLRKLKVPLVLDPVLGPSAGGAFVDKPKDFLPLLKDITLLMPNKEEAGRLLPKAHVGQWVLVKSHSKNKTEVKDLLIGPTGNQTFSSPVLAGDARGTGCTLATAAACFLAQGQTVPAAVASARHYLSQAKSVAQGKALGLWQVQEGEVLGALSRVALRLERLPSKPILAEVGMNLAYCFAGASGPAQAGAFSGRLVDRGGMLHVPGFPSLGASNHVARLAIQMHRLYPEERAAMNLRYSKPLLAMAKMAGLKGSSFERAKEPKTSQHLDDSTMDWGVREACKSFKQAPDYIWDLGAVGKEPMVRLFGKNPDDLLGKLEKLLGLDFL